MKTLRHLSLLVIFCCAINGSHAQYVTIPDVAFGNLLRLMYPSCMNGNQLDTTCMAITSQVSLSLSHSSIQNLSGVEYFDNLQSLELDHGVLNLVPAFPPNLQTISLNDNGLSLLPALPATLRSLSVHLNIIATLPALPQGLTYLNCNTNQLTTLPALPSTLEQLYCGYMNLVSLPALPASLTELYCQGDVPTHISIQSLPALPASLRILHCEDNEALTTLPALNQGLQQLRCGGEFLSGIPGPLPNSLTTLYCNRGTFTTIPALPASLTSLTVQNTLLTAMPTLPAQLTTLTCSYNKIATIPNLPNSLTRLDCSNNLLITLPAFPAGLGYIDCNSNPPLTSLPALPAVLSKFACANTPNLHCLPRLTTITELQFDATAIACLPNYGNVTTSNPPLSTKPLCDPFNTNGCQVLWNIQGNVFNDVNGNCVQQGGDKNLSFLKVNLFKNNTVVQQAYTTPFGFYSFDTDTGSFTTTIDTTGIPYTIKCPVSQFDSATITPLDSLKTGLNFAMQCKAGFDVGAQSVVLSTPVRPNTTTTVTVKAGDLALFGGATCNTANVSGQLVITISGPATYTAPAAGALTPVVSGNTLTYTVANWATVSANAFNFTVTTAITAQSGQQVCFNAMVTPTVGDNDSSNNHLTQCVTVVNGYDPNDKQVSPADAIDNKSQWLTYTIRFQNTGTAPAIHIYVLDTLDAALDITSFQLLAYSHQPVVNIYNNARYARFTFPNINLADSVHNEPASHGYIQYRVKTIAGLNCGTQIGNAAHIYFDFNPPVATNAAISRIYMSSTTNLQSTTCSNEPFNFNGQALTATGDYDDTLQAAFACDSFIHLHLDVLPGYSENENATVCHGETYNWHNRTLNATGDYADTLQAVSTCDSIINLHLDVLQAITQNQTATTCAGEPFNFNGRALTTAGDYADTLQAVSTCDSIINLHLNVLPGAETTENAAVCNGEAYNWHNQNLTTQGTYTDTLQTTTGCDSVLILNFEVNNATAATVNITLIEGNITILPLGDTVSVAGTYIDTVQNAFGCDSVITTNVSVVSGIDAIAANATMQLYPNPATDIVHINLSDNLTSGTLTLSDVTGRSLTTIQLTGKHNQLNTAELSSGVYLVTAAKGGVRVVQRIVISR